MAGDPLSAHRTRDRFLLLAAAVLWSTSGLLMKSPPLEAIPVGERGPLVACFRALVAGLCLVPFVNWKRARFHRRMIPMALAFAAMNFLFVAAMTRATAAAAIFLQYTGIGWAFLFGVLFLKERITLANFTALAFGLAGIAWIVGGQWQGSQFVGTLMALASGLA